MAEDLLSSSDKVVFADPTDDSLSLLFVDDVLNPATDGMAVLVESSTALVVCVSVGALVAALDSVSGDAVADFSAVDVARDVSIFLVDVLLDNAEVSCVVSVLEEVSFRE